MPQSLPKNWIHHLNVWNSEISLKHATNVTDPYLWNHPDPFADFADWMFVPLTWTWALGWAHSEFAPAPVGSSRARRSRPGSRLWCTGAWHTATRRKTERGREVGEESCRPAQRTHWWTGRRHGNSTGGTGVWRRGQPIDTRQHGSAPSLPLISPPLSSFAPSSCYTVHSLTAWTLNK